MANPQKQTTMINAFRVPIEVYERLCKESEQRKMNLNSIVIERIVDYDMVQVTDVSVLNKRIETLENDNAVLKKEKEKLQKKVNELHHELTEMGNAAKFGTHLVPHRG